MRKRTRQQPRFVRRSARLSGGTRLLLCILLMFVAAARAAARQEPVGSRTASRSAGYRRVFGDPYYVQVIWNSLKLALITTFIALLTGYPAAFALARAKRHAPR